MNTLEHLRKLEAEATPGPWHHHSAFGRITDSEHEQFIDVWRKDYRRDTALIAEMRNALPRLLTVVEAHKAFIAYCEDRFTWSAKPHEWEYMTDERELKQAKDALAALEEGG